MKPSPKLTRGRKQRQKNTEQPSSSNIRTQERGENREKSNERENDRSDKMKAKKRTKKRSHDEFADIPSPPAAKRRKKKNLTNSQNKSPESSSNDDSIDSGSSKGEHSTSDQHSHNLFNSQPSPENRNALSFEQYLKVN